MKSPPAADRSKLRSVGYVLTHYPRITQTFIAAEIAELRRRGVEVLVCSMNSPTPADADHPEVAETVYLKAAGARRTLGALAHAFKTSPVGFITTFVLALRTAGADAIGMARRGAHFGEAMIVWSSSERAGIEQLHAHFGQSPSAVAWIAAEFGRRAGSGPDRFTYTVHCASEVYEVSEAIPAIKAEAAAAVLAVTDHTRSQIQWAIDPDLWDKVKVVRVGVDLSTLEFAPHPVVGAPPRVIIVGRLAPAKGHLVLVEAIGELRRQGTDVAVDVIGAGDIKDRIEARAAELGIADLIELHGEVAPHEVSGWLRQADAFCLPSFDEGLPVAMMEAMAMGVPVVSTYIAGIPELARDERTALVVPASNVVELATAIRRITSDDELRQRLTVNARKAVEASHNALETLDDFVRALEQA